MDDYQYYSGREHDMRLREMEYENSARSSRNHGFPSVKLLRRRFNSPLARDALIPTSSQGRDNSGVTGSVTRRSVSESPHRGEKRTAWNPDDRLEYCDKVNDYQQSGIHNWQYLDQRNAYPQSQDHANWYGGEDNQNDYRYSQYNYPPELYYHSNDGRHTQEKPSSFQRQLSLGDIKMLDPAQQDANGYQDAQDEYVNYGDDDGRLDFARNDVPYYYNDGYEYQKYYYHDQRQENYKSNKSKETGNKDSTYQAYEREFKNTPKLNHGDIRSMEKGIGNNLIYASQDAVNQQLGCIGDRSMDKRKTGIITSRDLPGNKINVVRQQNTFTGERKGEFDHSDETNRNIAHQSVDDGNGEDENALRRQKKMSTTPINDRININNSRDSKTALANNDNKYSHESHHARADNRNAMRSDETSDDESSSKWDHISEDVQLWKRQISPEEHQGDREEVISSDSSESISNKRNSCIKNKRKVGKSQSVHWEKQYSPREDKTRNKEYEPSGEKRRHSHKDRKSSKASQEAARSRNSEKDIYDLPRSPVSRRKSPRTKRKIDKKKQKLLELKRRLSLHYGPDLEVIEMLLSKDRHAAKDLLALKDLRSPRKLQKHEARENDDSEDDTDSVSTRSIIKPSTPAIVVDDISEIFETKQKNQNARTRDTSRSTLTDCNDGYWQDNAACNNVWCPEQAFLGRTKGQGTVDKSGHFLQMGKYMRNLHQNQQLLDVKIVIGDQTFLAHRIALSCHSEYFADLFSKQSVAKRKYPLEIHIKGVTALAFRVFLEFVYTGEIRRPPQEGALCEMMMAAEKLLIPYMRERCEDFASEASPEEALLLLKRSSRQSRMFQIAYDIVIRNMQDLLCSKTFLQLDLETVCDLLSDNSLSVSSEVLVFGLSVRWMEYAKCERYKYAPRLIECVRLSLMNNKELVHCADSSPLFKDYPVCRDKLLRANWISTCRTLKIPDPLLLNRAERREGGMPCSGPCQSRPESRIGSPPRSTHPSRPPSIYGGKTPESAYTREPSREDFSSSRRIKVDEFKPCQYAEISEPRSNSSSKRNMSSERMEVIIPDDSNESRDSRGRSQKSATSASQYGGDYKQSRASQPQQLPPSFIPGVIGGAAKSYQATPLISNEILAIGGSSKDAIKGGLGVQHYSTSKNQWTQYAILPEPRQNHATALLGDRLYLTGGRSSKKKNSFATNSVFVFDMENKSWESMPNMKDCRMNHALCPMFGLLYAIGGQNEKGVLLKSMECYNPHTNAWDYVQPMSQAREGVGATMFQDKLFVAGGYGPAPDKKSGKPVLGLVECFDPRQNKWSEKEDLRIPRCHANLMVGAGKMFMFGGATRSFGAKESELVSLSSVDVYLPGTDGWKYVTDLVTARHSAGAVTLVNKIYIVGGISSANDRVLKSVECFDADSGSWVSEIQDLIYPAKSLGCSIAPLSLPKKAS